MGSRFLAAGSACSAVWYVVHWRSFSFVEACWRVALLSFVSGIVGKIIGILLYRRKTAQFFRRTNFRDTVDPATFSSLNPIAIHNDMDRELTA